VNSVTIASHTPLLLYELCGGRSTTHPQTFSELSAEVLCDETLWRQFAHHLVHAQSMTTSEPLSGGTCREYIRKVLGLGIRNTVCGCRTDRWVRDVMIAL
jgi:hypothetical protein